MDFLETILEFLEDAKASEGLSDQERGAELAKRFGKLLDRLEPGDSLRCQMAAEAVRREPKVLEPDFKVNRNHTFTNEDLTDGAFQFLAAEADSLGITTIVDDEMLLVKTGLSNQIFPYGTVSYPKVLSSLKDAIKMSRLYAARDSKLKDAVQALADTSHDWQIVLEQSWFGCGNDVKTYSPQGWQDYNVLCQIFTILGGHVAPYLDDYRSFRLTYIESKGSEGSVKLSWTLPYSLRSLAKFRDIVYLMLAVLDCRDKDDNPDDSVAVKWLKNRMDTYGWAIEFWEHHLSVTAGIMQFVQCGEDVSYRELRILTMSYTLSSLMPLLELMWQVESGKISPFRVPVEGRLALEGDILQVEKMPNRTSVDCEVVMDGRTVVFDCTGA